MFTKKFCCSNEAAKVAKMLAFTDMVFSILMIFVLSSFVHIHLNYPQTLRRMTEENPEKQEDLKKFLIWGPEKKALMLSVPFVGSILNGLKGLLLAIGAFKRHFKAIKLWLILTFIFFVMSLLSFVPEVIFTQDKGLIICISLIDWIYEVYSIWVVKCLFCELRQEASAQTQTHSTTRRNASPASTKSEHFLDVDTEIGTSIDSERF